MVYNIFNMKKLLPLLVTLPFIVASCAIVIDTSSASESESSVSYLPTSEEKGFRKRNIDVYELITERGVDYKKDDCWMFSYDLLFDGSDTLLPYATLKDFAEIYNGLATKELDIKYVKSETTEVLDMSIDGKDVHEIAVEHTTNKMIISGGIARYLMTRDRYSNSSLSYGLEEDDKLVKEGKDDVEVELYEGDYLVEFENEIYYPFSLLSAVFSFANEVTLFYNYQDIFVYEDYDDFDEANYYITNNTKTTPRNEMTSVIMNYRYVPQAVITDRYNTYSFVLRNFYGLAEVLGYDMKNALESINFKTNIAKTSMTYGNVGLYELNGVLDDRHTALFTNLWESGLSQIPSDEGSQKTKSQVIARNIYTMMARGGVYNSDKVFYSSSKKTAYINVPSFSNIFTPENGKKISDCTRDEIAVEDDAYRLAVLLDEVKKVPEVENVILDVSLNGGGFVGNLEKMISLLAKDTNGVILAYREAFLGNEYVETIKFDANIDGKFDLDDVYGDDYNFYIMTSGYSYSCANAFPFLAQKQNLATIIGETSGGGECAVYVAHMPTGEPLYYSSLFRLGYYQDDVFYGNNDGAIVEDKYYIGATNTKRYNFDYLEQLIGG